MLSEKQKGLVVTKVNREVDLPFLSEGSEGRIIDKFVDKLNEDLEPALSVIMPRVYLDSLKIALNERLRLSERRDRITQMMRGELSGPLARELNNRTDVKVLPENIEGKVFRVVADEIVEQFVKVLVGELDETLRGERSDSD